MEQILKKIYPYITRGVRVSTDSRDIDKDTVFFALRGETFDGNQFVAQALEKGALLAITDDKTLPENDKIIQVDDVLKTIQELARYHRTQLKIPVLGITGSNGKTTTKELVSAVLSKKFNTLFTPGNFNNHIGLPLTILGINPSHEFAVIEMGANHLGEIDFLCKIAQPDFGLITNIGKAHIEGFGSAENVVKAKTELYRYLEAKNGTAFLNADNEKLVKNCQIKKVITYGTQIENNFTGKIIAAHPFVKMGFSKAQSSNANTGNSIDIQTRLVGDYNFENILAAAAIGSYFEVEMHEIKAAIEEYSPSNSRSQLIDSGKNQIIMDAYNANPTSMNAAIRNFLQIESGPKTCILGDMLELGSTSGAEHEAIANMLLNGLFSRIILIGPEFSKLHISDKRFTQFKNYHEAAEWISLNPIMNHTILVKGSRGIKLEKLLSLL